MIRQLSEREKAREKLAVFFGSFDNYYHGVREVINNSVDEILNNFDTGTIEIELMDDNKTISIKDTGRGIPITDDENVKLLFETLFASGKYDVSENTNSGVNGVGNTVLQYSSEYFACISHTNGKQYKIEYVNGGETEGLVCLGDTNQHGTEIIFRLDDTVYTNVVFDKNEIELIIKRTSMISENIKFIFKYCDYEKTYCNTLDEYFDNNAYDLITKPYICDNKRYSKTIKVERQGNSSDVEDIVNLQVVFATSTSETPLKETMLNGNFLIENGTIYDGILEGFKSYSNKYAKDNSLFKTKEKTITNGDIENSISFVCRLFSNLVEFESQVKFSTKKNYYKEVAKEYIISNLEVYSLEQPKEFKRLVDQILISKRANDVNLKARQELKKKLTEKVDSVNNRVEGFIDCELDKGGEIFICEGNSALGSIVLARDEKTQSAYPLKGKLINTLKSNMTSIFKNDEIVDIIKLLGCGVELSNKFTKDLPKFNMDNLRFDKIICMSDADDDGLQINVLILTALYRLAPSLILNGKVYIAQSPLFEIKVTDDEKYYALTTKEKEEITSKLDDKYEVHRIKGLGELSSDAMYHTVCNTETRILQQVTVDDIAKMEETFKIWMDTEVLDRKDIIEDKLGDYLVDPPTNEVTHDKDIVDIISDNMMTYSASVIFDRALVSIESGLKPSQQRILWAMKKNNRTKFTKSQNITGDVTVYHPHGNSYPTIVNLVQTDRHMLPLITGEGNFGQHTSKQIQAGAERYTNAKLSDIALDSLNEVSKKYVEMIPNYDGKAMMPLYIPSKFPLILNQATMGMAVGMACKLPSFNFNEINNAIIDYISTGNKVDLIPDFATGGKLENVQNTMNSINNTGKGTLNLRGSYTVVGTDIYINQVPYGVCREEIVDKTIECIKNGKLKEVIDVKDLTGRKGMSIKVQCKKSANVDDVIAKLYKLTALEYKYSCNMNVLYNGMPKVCGVWEIIDKWILFRKECLTNGIKHKLSEINKELELLHALSYIVNHIDRVIEIIRFEEEPTVDLMMEFDLTLTQAEYIENMKLANINQAKLLKSIVKIDELNKEISKLENDCTDSGLNDIIVSELNQINSKYVVPRRTEIVDSFEKIKENVMVDDYNVVCYLTELGYFKKVRSISNKGNNKLRDNDVVKSTIETSNSSEIVFICDDNNAYKYKLHEIEESKLGNLGQYIQGELGVKILGMTVVDDNYKYTLIIDNSFRVAKIDNNSYKTLQNRRILSKSIMNNDIHTILPIKDDIDVIITVNDDRVKSFNTSELTVNKSRNSSGSKKVTWKNVTIKTIEFK